MMLSVGIGYHLRYLKVSTGTNRYGTDLWEAHPVPGRRPQGHLSGPQYCFLMLPHLLLLSAGKRVEAPC